MLSAIFNRLPLAVRAPLARWQAQPQLPGGELAGPEPAFQNLSNYLVPGACAIDVGARLGRDTLRMADIVGETGRVVSFESDPEAYARLCANVRRTNVTLINAFASARDSLARMGASGAGTGRVGMGHGNIQVPCLSIDELNLPGRVALLKIDARGHGAEVLEGAARTIARDRPTLVVDSGAPQGWFAERGYRCSRLGQSRFIVACAL